MEEMMEDEDIEKKEIDETMSGVEDGEIKEENIEE